MRIAKWEEEHLVCYSQQDNNGEWGYLIYEKDNEKEPVAIFVDREDLRLSGAIPENEKEYKYYDELCKIIQTLYEVT